MRGTGRWRGVTQPDPDGGGSLAAPVTTYKYDAGSNLIEVVDPMLKSINFDYDNLSRLIEEQLPDQDGAGPLSRPTTTYTYDAVGNWLTLTVPVVNTTTWNYDKLSRVLTARMN